MDRPGRAPALPVLLYHAIDDDPPSWIAPFAVGRRAFARQLDLVAASGRKPVTAAQVVAALTGGPALPPHAVAITFDDGFRDFAHAALPELQRRSLPSVLFVTTGALGPGNESVLPAADMLSLPDVVRLAADGVEIGSHTHVHPQLDVLRRGDVERELNRPKQILEQALGREVDLFAYPHGYSSPGVRKLTRRAGYRGAFAVRDAYSPAADDPFRIARLMVRAGLDEAGFEAWLAGGGAPVAPARERLRTTAWRYYRRGRARLGMAPVGF